MVTLTDQRRQRGQRNRAAVLAAALELFETQGFEATTVDQIVAVAGVAPRTFFGHFPSKEDVLFDGYAERLDRAARQFRANPGAPLWASLSAVASAVAGSILEDPDRYLLRARLSAESPSLRATLLRINEEWIDHMTVAIAERLGTDARTDVRPRLVAALLNGSNRAAIEVWVGSGGAADLERLMRDSLELLRPTVTKIERSHRV